jgi:hypothetical protein
MGNGTAWGMTLDRASDWRDLAACSLDTAYLFELKATRAGTPPTLTATNRLALKLCETCPVNTPCLEAALADDDPWFRIAGGQVVVP